MKELAFKSGFELVNVDIENMDAFMKERAQVLWRGRQEDGAWREVRAP